MAQLHLITGQPGHGKSLYAITLGLQHVADGRQVYAAGFKNLDYAKTGFKELPFDFTAFESNEKDDQGRILTKWQQLPHGSTIILDECYDYIPQRAAGKPVPPHVDAIARHRHTGHDIILVTQKHDQIDSFVKGLIGEHTHVRRKFGLNAAVLRKWDRFSQNVMGNDTTEIQRWAYPQKNYDLYTSATQHSVKRKLPWYVFALPILLCLVPLLGWYAWHGFKKNAEGTTATTGALATGGAGVSGVGDAEKQNATLRAKDYPKWITARVAGQPWTAPAYDSLQAQTVPEIYCIAVEDANCKCITEQGTTYALDLNMCRNIALNGAYNPFRRQQEQQGQRGDRGQGGADRERERTSALAKSNFHSDADGRMFSVNGARYMRQDYTPPQLTTAPGG